MAEFSGYFEVVKQGEVVAVGKGTVKEINWGDHRDVKVVKKSNHEVKLPDSSKQFNLTVDGVELLKGDGYVLTDSFKCGDH